MQDKNRFISVAVTIAVLFFFQPSASAQRQMPGQMELSFRYNPVIQNGGSIEWAMYGFPGKLCVSLNYQGDGSGDLRYDMVRMNADGKYIDDANGELGPGDSDRYIYDSMSIRIDDVYASIGYRFRILSSRSRSLSLFLGASYDIGMRLVGGDPESIVYRNEFELAHKDEFRYEGYKNDYRYNLFTTGFSPEMEIEWFPFKKVSLSAYCKPRLVIVNSFGQLLNVQAGLGLNFYLIGR